MVTEFARCKDDRWFPTRWIWMDDRSGKSGHRFKELKVTQYEVDKRPDASEFSLELKAGTSIVNKVNSAGFKLKQVERVHLEQLPRLIEMANKARSTPKLDSALPPVSKLRQTGL